MNPQEQSTDRKKVLLALQGGAALGAFGWGVLDRLLEDQRLEIEGASGTSSGAVNALLVAYGLIGNDPHSARALLEQFWQRISEESESRRWEKLRSIPLLGSKMFQIRRKEVFLELMSRMLLPYRYDPFTMDPLRTVIDETVDFDRLRSSDAIRLFINATNIATNKNRVFAREEISLEAVCASCCLPFLFEAVEVDGEKYWDGAYLGNPTIYPLIYECSASDIILVFSSHLGPKHAPGTSAEIISRICQVSFTSALVRELRAIKFVTELLERGYVTEEAGMRKVNIHIIAPSGNDPETNADTNFSADWPNLKKVHTRGRQTADVWLRDNFGAIGQRSTVDLESLCD